MPYCTSCGSQVNEQALFCHTCGAPQKRRQEYIDPLTNISDRTASILCYIPVFGVIPAIIFLAILRYRHNARVRFDAFQSLYLFVAFLIVSSVLPPFLWFGMHSFGIHLLFVGLLKGVIFILWLYLLVKAAQEQQVHLPVVGDLAARSAAEQL